MGILAVVTPAATFIENRLRLGHPSKLVALGLHCFCAYSAFCACAWLPGALPQALYYCAYSARCSCAMACNHYRQCYGYYGQHG